MLRVIAGIFLLVQQVAYQEELPYTHITQISKGIRLLMVLCLRRRSKTKSTPKFVMVGKTSPTAVFSHTINIIT